MSYGQFSLRLKAKCACLSTKYLTQEFTIIIKGSEIDEHNKVPIVTILQFEIFPHQFPRKMDFMILCCTYSIFNHCLFLGTLSLSANLNFLKFFFALALHIMLFNYADRFRGIVSCYFRCSKNFYWKFAKYIVK